MRLKRKKKVRIIGHTERTFECKICGLKGEQNRFKVERNPSLRKEMYKCPQCKGHSIFVKTVEYKEIKKGGFFHSHTKTETRTTSIPLHEWLRLRNLKQVGQSDI